MESGDFKVGRPHESATALFLVGQPPPDGAKLCLSAASKTRQNFLRLFCTIRQGFDITARSVRNIRRVMKRLDDPAASASRNLSVECQLASTLTVQANLGRRHLSEDHMRSTIEADQL